MRRIRKRKNSGLPVMWWFLLVMFIVCGLLVVVMWPRGENTLSDTEHVPGGAGVTQEANADLPPGWSSVPEAQKSDVIKNLGSRVLFFEKKDGMKVQVLEDDYVQRKITVTVGGLTSEQFSSEDWKCVVSGKYERGLEGVQNGMSGIMEDWEISVSPAQGGTYEATIVFSEQDIYECRVESDENYFFLDFYRPKELYASIVLVDAGHGAPDVGTSSADGVREKDLTLSYTLALKELADKQDKVKFYYTRLEDDRLNEDYSTDLHLRPEIANNLEADLFLSIHFNAHENKNYSGTQVYYNETQNEWTTFCSKDFAQALLDKVPDALGLKPFGIFPAAELYTVVKESAVPVALLETGYLSHTGDAAAVTDPALQKAAVQAIYDTLMECIEEMQNDGEN